MKHSNVDGRNMSYISISQQIYVKQRHPIVNQQLKKEKQDLAKQISFLFHMDTYRSTIVGSIPLAAIVTIYIKNPSKYTKMNFFSNY